METKRKTFLTYIKGHNAVVSERNQPTSNPISLLPETNVYAKFEEIGQKVLKLEHGNEALTDRRMNGWQTDGHADTQSLEGIT